jgi:hypothetical protein
MAITITDCIHSGPLRLESQKKVIALQRITINIVSVTQRHHRLAYTGILCAVLLIVGLIALNFPVFLDDYDQFGFQIKCGTGYATDLTQAAATAGERNFADECETALLMRRMWIIPLVAVSALVLLAVVTASAVTSARESLVPHRENA